MHRAGGRLAEAHLPAPGMNTDYLLPCLIGAVSVLGVAAYFIGRSVERRQTTRAIERLRVRSIEVADAHRRAGFTDGVEHATRKGVSE